jgi:hypothetical protein
LHAWRSPCQASQARLLFAKPGDGRRPLSVLEDDRQALADRVRRTIHAQTRGLVAGDVVLPTLAGLRDVDKQPG